MFCFEKNACDGVLVTGGKKDRATHISSINLFQLFQPFYARGLFLYPLKTLKKL